MLQPSMTYLLAKLEVTLGSNGQWTHMVEMQGITDTNLTDYFVRK